MSEPRSHTHSSALLRQPGSSDSGQGAAVDQSVQALTQAAAQLSAAAKKLANLPTVGVVTE
jgi:hypothetical protein